MAWSCNPRETASEHVVTGLTIDLLVVRVGYLFLYFSLFRELVSFKTSGSL